MLVQGVPPELARRYREAARSYFFRNPLACCAMCRAVAELALAEACEDRLRLNPDSFTLDGLIDSLEKAQLLLTDAATSCPEVKRNGDSSMLTETIFQSDAAYRENRYRTVCRGYSGTRRWKSGPGSGQRARVARGRCEG